MQPFHIGLDLDNTIIDYDRAFAELAVEMGLFPAGHAPAGKEDVKSRLATRPDGEQLWMRLQGQVYGRHIDRGRPSEGVTSFLRGAHRGGARLSIVSHKTRYGHYDANRVNLWDAALGWLERQGFFAGRLGLRREDVHFTETREQKLATIGRLGCDVFVDDLPDVLLHPDFPARTQGLWFAAGQQAAASPTLTPFPDWPSLRRAVRRIEAGRTKSTEPVPPH